MAAKKSILKLNRTEAESLLIKLGGHAFTDDKKLLFALLGML
jgi:hypothetical protein